MEHSIALAQFPTGIDFPADLKLRIRYDPIRRRLVFLGFMSKSEFDRLQRLSDDWGYRRALEDLFRLCTFSEPRSGVFGRVLAALGMS